MAEQKHRRRSWPRSREELRQDALPVSRAFTRFARVEYANGEEVPAERFLTEVETVVLETILARVVVEREVPDRFAEVVRLHRVLRGLIPPADILVIAEKDFEEWSEAPGSVYRSARREGKVLYEAA